MELKISLTESQLKMLAAIAADAGQVFLAAAVVPFLISPNQASLITFFAGIGLTMTCWLASIIWAK